MLKYTLILDGKCGFSRGYRVILPAPHLTAPQKSEFNYSWLSILVWCILCHYSLWVFILYMWSPVIQIIQRGEIGFFFLWKMWKSSLFLSKAYKWRVHGKHRRENFVGLTHLENRKWVYLKAVYTYIYIYKCWNCSR